MSETEQKLREMAKLSVLSNRINEIQEKNLKMFPFVFFNAVKSVKIDYDFSRVKPAGDQPDVSNSRIEYYLEIDQSEAANPELSKRFDALEKSVRHLFWQDTTVEVYINDKICYKSKKNV